MPSRFTPAEALERHRKEAKRRLKALKNGDEETVRWFRQALPNAPANPTLREVQHAIARNLDFSGWTALKRALEKAPPPVDSKEAIVNRFLDNACPDHHVRGKQDHRRAASTGVRLLEQHPWIPLHDFNTAVVCGEIGYVRDAIARDARVARMPSSEPSAHRAGAGGANDLYADLGPKGWTPLLYLTFTRLPLPTSNDHAVEIARLLLENGADPNAYFHAGGSYYTPMTGAAGEGEEDRPPHPRRDELVQLLLDHDAHPYDIQVVYNLGFHSEYMWWLPMIYERSVKTGRAADWQDPEWAMLDMGGYGSGARWFLQHAIAHGNVTLAKWCLEHGATPNARPARDSRLSKASLYEEAIREGQPEIAELLVRYGAQTLAVERDPAQSLMEAASRRDRAAVEALLHAHPELRTNPKPMFHAAHSNRADVIHLLIDTGTSPDVADEANMRALHEAAYVNALDAARALIERGAEIDPVERNHGGTPFGGAAHFLNREVMELLAPLTRDVWNLTYDGRVERLRQVLEENPESARVDWDEWSPLLWLPPHDEDAALAIAQLFVEYGADPGKRDSNGVSPADRAEALGMTRLSAYLRSTHPGVVQRE